MSIALRTVIFHLERMTEKLGASSKSRAISWALKQGLIRPNIDAVEVGNIGELSE
ncbi:helix-turn-helix transcriptional regulator [Aeromonas hydrophila]|uniref:helix-turn-helix transcriptional regulator n=1 Tax=Aeromonas hydrophila TaxID=644 RepID=UPI001F1C1D3E|nr:helix-turn-helix transcriptional regulator [Aeromonas hydrophila]